MKHRYAITAALLICTNVFAGSYPECILDNMPGTKTQTVAYAVNESCEAEYPEQYENLKRGFKRGFTNNLWGYKNGYVCISAKAKNTTNKIAQHQIARACHCMYSEPIDKSQLPPPTDAWDKIKQEYVNHC